MNNVGRLPDHTDGLLKVMGQARYFAGLQVPRLVRAVLMQNTVSAGRISRVDAHVTQAMPDVLLAMTHESASYLPNGGKLALEPPVGRVFSLLQDDRVHYNGQLVALVVDGTLEYTQIAVRVVRTGVVQQMARLDFEAIRADTHLPGKVQRQSVDTMHGDLVAGTA